MYSSLPSPVVDIGPVVDTGPVDDTDPVVNTGPVVDTGPVVVGITSIDTVGPVPFQEIELKEFN